MKAILFAVGSFLFVALFASSSRAQLQRSFVSGLGSDGNPCTRTAPCRTFGQAVSQTNSSGEVYVLDSAGYSTFTITKSISIVAPPGVTAGISVFSGDGIDINAGASDAVMLRGLTINAQGGNNGVVLNTGGALRVDGCAVRGFIDSGITLSAGTLVVKDTVISDCGAGVSTLPFSGTVHVTMDHITVEGCQFGLDIDADGTATTLAAIRDSTISDSVFGITTLALGAASSAFLDVERCLIANGRTGFFTQSTIANSAMSISNCVISHNSSAGFMVGPGTAIFSRGNNSFIGNGPNSGSLTPFSAQ